MSLAELVECPMCKKEVKKLGLSVHQRLHCPSKKGKPTPPVKKTVKKKHDNLSCKCPDGGDQAMLAGSIYAHATTVDNPDSGKKFFQYCTKCGEAW